MRRLDFWPLGGWPFASLFACGGPSSCSMMRFMNFWDIAQEEEASSIRSHREAAAERTRAGSCTMHDKDECKLYRCRHARERSIIRFHCTYVGAASLSFTYSPNGYVRLHVLAVQAGQLVEKLRRFGLSCALSSVDPSIHPSHRIPESGSSGLLLACQVSGSVAGRSQTCRKRHRLQVRHHVQRRSALALKPAGTVACDRISSQEIFWSTNDQVSGRLCNAFL
jgi:hypothetical protein